MSLLWKSIRKTDSYDYQQHRLHGGRRAVKLRAGARWPNHREWLDGGNFNEGTKRVPRKRTAA